MFHGRSTRIRMHTSSTFGLHPIMILHLFWQVPHKKSCANREKRYESLPSVSEVVLGNSSTLRADICSREYDKSNQQEQKAQILKFKKLFLFASGLFYFQDLYLPQKTHSQVYSGTSVGPFHQELEN